MYSIHSLVSVIPKIGPKYRELLKNLEIVTVGDLLYHFPFRYDDFSITKLISDLNDGDNVTVEATILSINNIFTKNGKRLTKVAAQDITGKIDIIWFNQHYLKTVFKEGETYYFSGKAERFNNKMSLISPSFELKTDSGHLNTGRLVPVYPETTGVSSKYLRSKIYDVLSAETDLREFLPQEILEKENLQNINWSINQIHFPASTFEATLARDRFAFEELFLEMLKVETRKNQWATELKGIKMKPNTKEISEFIQNLPFELTPEQQKSIEDIIQDMSEEKPMNRLLEGDVGTGKTVVAIVSAYLAHLNGYKTLYMAPTEILAKQHYETFKKFLPNLEIKIITGSKKDTELHTGNVLIGTHALLFTKEELKDIGLVIIDEQHRFGVAQRGKLMEMGNAQSKVPHFLSMTATPIPRTLALTFYGDLDISILKNHPNKERKITTKVVPATQRESVYKWIREKNEQTFIVCPLIEESESVSLENVKAAEKEFAELQKGVFKGLSVGLLHGRMKPKEKQEIIDKFRNKEIHILVSTPVIEVGIDVPDAAVIVIESAERYGLASLHQLRGRVGRGKKEGFCFVSMSTNSRTSYERLKNLEELNNGLDLAEIDMKMRGTGDIFGTMQHGFKKFRVASIHDVEFLEKSKLWAKNIYPRIDNYPMLKEKIQHVDMEYIKNN